MIVESNIDHIEKYQRELSMVKCKLVAGIANQQQS